MILMSIKHELRRMLWKIGYDISRFDPASHVLARRKKLLESYAIDILLDVGANEGQFARQMRKDVGFSGKIVSFEPLSSAFKKLKITATTDPKWKVINCALGDVDTKQYINIAGNSESSSILSMLPSHIKSAPESKYIGRELVEVKTLDSMINNLCSPEDNVFLKIDTQGFESKVIKGAENALFRIDTIQLEMSLIPLYEGELIFSDMHRLLSEKGYTMVSIEPVFIDNNSGQLLQVDGIYHRF
jgi:FkbM family methyltransferase